MTAQVTGTDILDVAREQVLERGEPLTQGQIERCCAPATTGSQDLLALAHEVRMKYQGPASRSRASSRSRPAAARRTATSAPRVGSSRAPVRSVWLNIPELVRAAKATAATGASEFCIVAAVRGPDDKLMEQMREGVAAIRAAVDINVAASLGMLTPSRSPTSSTWACTATTTTSRPAVRTSPGGDDALVGGALGHLPHGQGVRHGAVLRRARRHGRDPRAARRARRQLGELEPHEVPLNFLNPRPGTPFGDLEPMETNDALRTIAAFRLALPRTILRYAGGRELTLGDLGTRDGLLGGINAVIVGNYLTTLGGTRGGPRAARRARDADQGPQRHVLIVRSGVGWSS
jgi:biotin synthase